jgi:hypothetical protein
MTSESVRRVITPAVSGKTIPTAGKSIGSRQDIEGYIK